MRTLVTVVLVAHQGGEWLEQTLEGLAEQTRPPERIVAVNNGGSASVTEQLAAGGAASVVTTETRLSFGAAVQQALAVVPHGMPVLVGANGAAEASGTADAADGLFDTAGQPLDPAALQPDPTAGLQRVDSSTQTSEWIWLLTEDTCPEPKALARILRTVERAPSVAVAGPKLVNWDAPDRIIELGQSLTRYGTRWKLRRQELDQQQYDHLQDVLGVGPAGMLVRRDVWEQLEGFDPALPIVDDGLDLCVRARLAGHRVVVAPLSRVRFAQSGIAGPQIERKRRVMRAAHREDRAAQTHRRIAYAPAFIAFFMWLGLPFYALGRVLWALIREQPGNMLGEVRAAMRVFFHPGAILASRRRIKAHSAAGWPAVRPLRVDRKTVRTANMIDREAILAAQGRQRKELHFISSGGLAVTITALVLATVLGWWALAQTSLTGGALAPLSGLDMLWQNTKSADGVPADPFTWVLALLGSLTFWNPSHAVVLLYIAAIPLAALGGWIWAAQLTDSRAGRALLGLGWAISPVLLGSLASGRLPTLILAVVLPWLLLAATRSRDSWSWAGLASLLAAIALACAPILIPAAILLLIVGLATSMRGFTRVITTAIAPLALFAPKIVYALVNGRPLDLLLDPGITPVYEPGTTWHMLLGFPEFGLEGWGVIFEDIGLGGPPATLLVGVLMLLIAVLALLGLFTARVPVTIFSSLLGGLGLLTAIAATSLHLVTVGPVSVPLWTGSGLALYWIGVLSLAVVGASMLRQASASVVSVALVTALIAVTPLAVTLITAGTGLKPGYTQMPAIVQAAGEADPEVRTLVLTAEGPSSVRAEIVVGSGRTLDQLRTAAHNPAPSSEDQQLAELIGGLASSGTGDLADELQRQHIGFVLLSRDGDNAERAQLQSVFDQHSALSSAGQTDHGLLWRGVAADPEISNENSASQQAASGAAIESTSESDNTALTQTLRKLGTNTLWWAQIVVLLGIALLALPTGEVVERPARRKKPAKQGRGSATPVSATSEPHAPSAPAITDTAELEGAARSAENDLADPSSATTGDNADLSSAASAEPAAPAVPEASVAPVAPVAPAETTTPEASGAPETAAEGEER